jgi:hypothetical protein
MLFANMRALLRRMEDSDKIFWSLAFAGYVLIWLMEDFPALTQAWWYRDDFTLGWLMDRHTPVIGSILVFNCFGGDGRPLGPFFSGWPFGFNHYPHTGFNLAIRWAQGLGHVSLSLLIAFVLSRQLPRWQAIVAVLPFLTWAFNGEAVMYSSIAQLIAGSFFALVGAVLIMAESASRRPILGLLGALLIISAVLIYQPAGTVGMSVWVMMLSLRLINDCKLPESWRREAAWLVGGFGVGGLITTWVALVYTSSRAKAPLSLEDKLAYGLELYRTFFFWPRFYPALLDIFHGILLLGGLILPVAVLASSGQAKRLPLLGGLIALIFVLPFFANLIVASDAFSFRTFYLAPLILVALISIGFKVAARLKGGPVVLLALVALTCIQYIPLARENARDYVRLYRGELETVRELEKFAVQNGCYRIGFLPDDAMCNPYGLRYPWGDGHACDFTRIYAVGGAIELLAPNLSAPFPSPADLSTLKSKIKDLPTTSGIHFHFIPDLHIVYLEVH